MTDLSNLMRKPPEKPRDVVGRVHSVSALGTGAGPGVRFVIFLDGCPLRCAQCAERDDDGCHAGGHDDLDDAEPIAEPSSHGAMDSLIGRIARHADYMRVSGGGVTVAGAEPLAQAPFVRELFRRCHAMGVRTALDTSGGGNVFAAKGLLHLTDLVVLDLTPFEPGPLAIRSRFADMLRASGKPIWIRLAVIPGVNDQPRHVRALAEFAASLPEVERVEVLPFSQLATIKLRDRCPVAALRTLAPPTVPQVRAVRNMFRGHGLRTC
ncbi:pyruvate formate lyase-activating protein [Skermanella stibiiresistens SB22]|uniref:Pyruvate formate lyase-activating protein n=1 Tax=Skermanella stibiiresistens SB22 TaxID=1385369 RepID=W9H0C0_9PROT|nr:radical SAM protein [Skermanella stibiiresistens]EWY38137.1 pyruvate formate lyase-activating protein [Skermanella stibiiresistens SB22]